MNYRNYVDTHTHSIHSFDGNHSCDALVKSAIDKGITIIAITDHCDIDGADMDIDKLCSNQLKDIDECIEKYNDKILILKGIEIGQGIYRRKQTDYLLSNYDYDFTLGSLHNLCDMEDFYFLDYSKYDIHELLERYFNDLLELCNWGVFDSLAHLTYPLRYMVGRDKLDVDMSRFSSVIDEIFLSLIKNDKALEINTSGYLMEIGEPLPSANYVRRYKELGGKYITLGSDSHYAERLGQGIDRGMELAKEVGFDKITIYKKHQPVLVDLV